MDLTSEKRFTLTPATRQLLSELDDFVHFKVYLEGDFPAGFKRLETKPVKCLMNSGPIPILFPMNLSTLPIQVTGRRTEENYDHVGAKRIAAYTVAGTVGRCQFAADYFSRCYCRLPGTRITPFLVARANGYVVGKCY
jgi:hypothetical protein